METTENHPILILDGGFSNELGKRCSYNIEEDPLWTAKALMTDTEAVVQTHLEYLKAGADIIETCTYQATTPGLSESLGVSLEESELLIKNAVNLAELAVSKYVQENPDKRPLIAGSIGSYGAYLNDYSEYSGSYMDKVGEDEIVKVHKKRLEILGKSNVDVLALETMPSLKEVEILLKLAEELHIDKPLWVSFTLQENNPTRTAKGDPVTEAFKSASKYSKLWGFGTNCVNPKGVSEFIKEVKTVKERDNVRLIVYPNWGKTWISGQGWSNEEVAPISAYAKEWADLGASVIGGCCQVGPEQISQLRSTLFP